MTRRQILPVHRRQLLKGLALGGAASLTLGRALPVLADNSGGLPQTEPLLTLVNTTTAHTPFMHAVRQLHPAAQVQFLSTDLAGLLDFERRLRSASSLRVIGLLDDATATLAIDLARSAGARIQWLGQHSCAAGVTCHRLLKTDNTEQYSRQLSDSDRWLSELGRDLATAIPGARQHLFANTKSAPITGSFVSFSIHV